MCRKGLLSAHEYKLLHSHYVVKDFLIPASTLPRYVKNLRWAFFFAHRCGGRSEAEPEPGVQRVPAPNHVQHPGHVQSYGRPRLQGRVRGNGQSPHPRESQTVKGESED